MKLISKITLIAAFAAFFAQNAIAQVSFGIKAGANFTNMQLSDDEDDQAKTLTTFHAGVIVEAPISGAVSIRTGVELQSKGFRVSEKDSIFTLKSTVNPLYVQVPVVIAYNGSKFYIGAGPYLAIGVAGKTKVKGNFFGIESMKAKRSNMGQKPTTHSCRLIWVRASRQASSSTRSASA